MQIKIGSRQQGKSEVQRYLIEYCIKTDSKLLIGTNNAEVKLQQLLKEFPTGKFKILNSNSIICNG